MPLPSPHMSGVDLEGPAHGVCPHEGGGLRRGEPKAGLEVGEHGLGAHLGGGKRVDAGNRMCKWYTVFLQDMLKSLSLG